MTSGGANASVLDATGYVTARRSATVSAQITGTLTDVLIEEGDHVKEGQVLGAWRTPRSARRSRRHRRNCIPRRRADAVPGAACAEPA